MSGWIYSPLLPVAVATDLVVTGSNVAIAATSAGLRVTRRIAVTTGGVVVAGQTAVLEPTVVRAVVSWAEVSFGSQMGAAEITVTVGGVTVAGGVVDLIAESDLRAVTGNVTIGGAAVVLGAPRAVVSWAEVRFALSAPTVTVGSGAVTITGGVVDLIAESDLRAVTGNVTIGGGLTTLRRIQVYPNGAGPPHSGRTPRVPAHLTTRSDMSDEEFWQVIRARRLEQARIEQLPAAAVDLGDDEEDVIEMLLMAA